MRKNILLIYWLIAIIILPLAATAAQRPVLPTIAGQGPPQTAAGLVKYIYIVSLVAGAILAFGILIWAGILYIISAGNPARQQEARAYIGSAVLGLLLLLGAYLILNTINPALVELRFPNLQQSSSQSSQTTSPAIQQPTGGVPTPGGCTPACAPNENCIDNRCVPIF